MFESVKAATSFPTEPIWLKPVELEVEERWIRVAVSPVLVSTQARLTVAQGMLGVAVRPVGGLRAQADEEINRTAKAPQNFMEGFYGVLGPFATPLEPSMFLLSLFATYALQQYCR